jgi:hypothetical protein
VLPPTSPFLALNAHFGMLLGVPELELLSAYPRGKTRLHNAWLHGFGVVWGYGARVGPKPGDAEDQTPAQELRVEPGLALAPAGQELYLERAACLDLGAWYAKHEDDADLAAVVTTDGDGVVSFDAHVTLAPRACLTRPVPAISQPCAENASGTAFSRVSEQVQLELLPGLAAPLEPPPLPYHRLRVLFTLAEAVLPDDQDVVDARDAVLALASADQPRAYLDAFRRFAALDTADLAPFTDAAGARSLFPAPDDATIVLANVSGVRLLEQADGTFVLQDPPPAVDITVRPALVATSTIQELLCGPLFAAVAAKLGPAPAPAGGARATRPAPGKSDSRKRS